MHAAKITWVLEPTVFPPRYDEFRKTIQEQGYRELIWQDEWWESGRYPDLGDECVIFHGSLGNADRICRELNWSPGAFCQTDRFYCSNWYPSANRWLLNDRWLRTSVRELTDNPHAVTSLLSHDPSFFIRPDSPLKPFSGRVLATHEITPRSLDYGFYYEDLDLSVIVAPVKSITDEWRFLIVDGQVVTGSGYTATGRTPSAIPIPRSITEYVSAVAGELDAPERVYVMDVCDTADGLRLLELNPFSGADLYACDPIHVVEQVSKVAQTW